MNCIFRDIPGRDYGAWIARLTRSLVPAPMLATAARTFRWLPKFAQDECGAILIIMALVSAVLIGLVGLAIDVGVWYRTQRNLQNAADSAAISAYLNGSGTFQSEAKAVAARYGYVDGQNGITVSALNNQTCPAPNQTHTNCYSVTITLAQAPQFFSRVMGVRSPSLSGSAETGTTAGKGQIHSYCLLALAGSATDPAILTNGAPKADMSNCSLMSNTGATCHGHNLNATYGDAHGTNDGCGITENSDAPVVPDPYAYLSSNIPLNTCGSYPQEPAKKKDPALPASNQWSGAKTIGSTVIVCGDLQLTGNTTLTTASPGSVLVIENGQLDTNGYTLQTASGSALTVIFSGTSGSSYTHATTGGGTLDFPAPTSGTWQGMAIYQDPALTSGVDISAAGNSPTWDITGMVYLPHSSVTFSGAVNKSSNGASCFGLVVDNITINGTADILETGGCIAAGVTLPSAALPGLWLVR